MKKVRYLRGIPAGMHNDVLDKSKFVGYHQTGDCLLTAKVIMDNYGLKGQYGGGGSCVSVDVRRARNA